MIAAKTQRQPPCGDKNRFYHQSWRPATNPTPALMVEPKKPDLSLRCRSRWQLCRLTDASTPLPAGPERAVAISQNYFDVLENFGEYGTPHMRLPRRYSILQMKYHCAI